MQIRLIVDQASLHQLYHLLEFMFLRRCFSTALFLGRVSNHLQTQKSRKERREKNCRNWKWKYWHRKTENERRGKNTWQIWQEILLLKNWFFSFFYCLNFNHFYFFQNWIWFFLLFFIIFISFYFCRIILFFQFHCDYKKVE